MLRSWTPIASRAFSAAAAAAACPARPSGRPTPSPGPNPTSSTLPFTDMPSPPSSGPYGTFPDFQTRIQKTDMREAVNSYYREYGTIVKHNMAGQEEVWCFDPAEYLKVMSKQGKYPYTIAVDLNFVSEYNKLRGRPELLSGRGEMWKKDRTMLQKDLFNPPDAVSYVKSLDPAVKAISRAAPKFERLSQMTSLAAMDMFCSVMLGFLPNCTAAEVGQAKCDPSDRAFVEAATSAMELIGEFNLDPVARQNVTAAPKYGEFVKALDDVIRLASERVKKLGLNGSRINEVSPYMERLLARGEIDADRGSTAVQLLLFAGVDTTHHVLQWLLLNVARNPRVQEELYAEVKAVVGDGPLEVEHLTKLPYLTKVLRENHRMSPPAPGSVLRKLEEDVDLCGYLVPANTRLMLMSDAIQNDPNIVDNAHEFRPERWNDDQVAQRKGTPRQILDHQMLAKPFGYGARMCLGARVAELELKSLLVRMVTDWKFTVADPNESYHTVMGLMLKPEPFPKVKFEARR